MVQPIQNVISFTKRRQHGDKANKLRRGKTELHANSYSDETLPLKINFMKSDGIRKAYVIKNYYQPKIFSIRQNARKQFNIYAHLCTILIQHVVIKFKQSYRNLKLNYYHYKNSTKWKLKILVYQLFTTEKYYSFLLAVILLKLKSDGYFVKNQNSCQ
ncbi:hypothetical protein T05_9592 [Trichinella murrelli]|uniref:Uncharacterized protein n=1 Tax=Trichinella murrelli TaxID=144512 RepID=A0A0V0U9Y6_9BILA|nr:hypothetical protein T05_9592 [Trichinella murrelli]